MNRYVKNRDLPHPPPVQRIEMPAPPSKARVAAFILLLGVGAAALAYGFNTLLSGEPGWQQISPTGAADLGEDYVLLYELGAGAGSAAAEGRALERLYSQALQEACELFSADEAQGDTVNLHALNAHPGQALTVAPDLYEALRQIQEAGDRSLYLGPVYELYDDMFLCSDDAQAAYYDPARTPEMAAFYDEVAAFACDPAMVDVELLENDQVRLKVAPAYAAFAQENEFDRYLDLFWLKNAFVVDHVADALAEAGYTHGAFSSKDGFARSLDSRGVEYAFPLYVRDGGTVCPAGVLRYTDARAIVCLHDHPLPGGGEAQPYYTFADGTSFGPYLDARDARSKSACSDLVLTAPARSCAALLLQAIPAYVTPQLQPAALRALAQDGTAALYCREGVLYTSDPALRLTDLYDDGQRRYTVQPIPG